MTDTIFGKDETKSDAQGVKAKPKPSGSWLTVWMFCIIWMNFKKVMAFMVADTDLANALGLAATILAFLIWRLWNRRRTSCGRAGKHPQNARIGKSGDDADRRLGRGPGALMRIGGRGRR